jgi:hypothetical protein
VPIVSSAVTKAQSVLAPIRAVLTTSVSFLPAMTLLNQVELTTNTGSAQYLAKSSNDPGACGLPLDPALAPLSDHFDNLLVAQQAKEGRQCYHFT